MSLLHLLTGNILKNILVGTLSADLINGLAGADRMTGREGNDTYVVDNAGDRVVETSTRSMEIDRVRSSVSYTLGTNLERLTLTGTSAIAGTGNDLANVLAGNSAANRLEGHDGNDRLAGHGGKDVLSGGSGDDTFIFKSATDSSFGIGHDVIKDWGKADKIDLSAIDANPTVAGHQDFTFTGRGTGDFIRKGELSFYSFDGKTFLIGGLDADAAPEIQIQVNGLHNLSATRIAGAHALAASAGKIDHPDKIGIGTWDMDNAGTALKQTGAMDFGWYYNWKESPLWSSDAAAPREVPFVPMIWDGKHMTQATLAQATASASNTLLTFNEPDNSSQAHMSVAKAIALWPELMDTGKRLVSPAPVTTGAMGDGSWLKKFMHAADAKDYRVDVIAVHYYSADGSIAKFKNFLADVHKEYDRPIWVTEWALVDWNDTDKFAPAEIADFARKGTLMMDDLSFVERQAWFGAYDSGDGHHVHTELLDSRGHLTPVGEVFADLTGAATHGSDLLY